MRLNVFGYPSGMLEYNVHVRGLIDGLADNGVETSLTALDGAIPKSPCGALLESLKRQFDFDSPSVCLTTPADFHKFYGSRRIGYTSWDTSRIPDVLVDILNKMDDVWTVSKFTKRAFLESGVGKDVGVVPPGVDTSVFSPYADKMRKRDENTFIFLSAFRWERRSGVDALLKAYSAEFCNGENVALLLQTYNPLSNGFNPYAEIMRMGLSNLSTVDVLGEPSTEVEMARRYVTSDCFVLPTRGEAWGSRIAEAMACGLPVITTKWGGHLDYVKDDHGWLIDVEDTSVPHDEPYYRPYDGNMWANPSIEHLRELMRYAFENKDECTKRGFDAYKHIDENYSWKKSAAVAKEVLE